MSQTNNTTLGEGELGDAEVLHLRRFLDESIGPGKAFRTNVELAERAELGESTIRKVRHGGAIANATFNKLARAFGFQPSQFKAQLEALEQDKELKRALADEIRTAVRELPEEDQAEILEFIRLKQERRRRTG